MTSTLEQSSSVSQVQTTSHTVEATFKTALDAYSRVEEDAGEVPAGLITADTILLTADTTQSTADVA